MCYGRGPFGSTQKDSGGTWLMTKLVRSWPAALAILWLATGTAPAQDLHPNSERYSDLGARPSSNRSGGATLAVQGLLGRDGVTDFTLVSGSAATGQPGGSIAKAQFKAFYDGETEATTDDPLIFTRNYKAPRGTSFTSQSFDDLVRGQRVQ